MKLILVRHGETAWNRDGVVQGRKDIELSELGRQQAELVALALKDEPIEGIYSSPLKRALETARAIARNHQAPLELDACLIELDAGELDGLTYQEMRSGYSEFLKEWARDAGPVKLPGGECLQELQDRAWPSIERIKAKHPKGTVVVVSHNFAILTIICKAIGLRLCDFRRLRLGVAGLTVIDFSERGAVLALLNDTCHLRTKSS